MAVSPSLIKGLGERLAPLGAGGGILNMYQLLAGFLLIIFIIVGFWFYIRRGQGKGSKGRLKHVEASETSDRTDDRVALQ
ncbi:MAG: hypothetical protein HYU02_04150 [Thaumarchaeota archaeon]|nr:hypothetical protein [Nitrososphaerota archaeon]